MSHTVYMMDGLMPFKRPAKMLCHDDAVLHLRAVLSGTDLDVTSNKDASGSWGPIRTFFTRFLYLFWLFKRCAKAFPLVVKVAVPTFGCLRITSINSTWTLIYYDNPPRNVKGNAGVFSSVVETTVTLGMIIALAAFY